jgi:four helix bundle protein
VAKFERFEDIEAWQKGRTLMREVYRLTDEESFSRDHAFRDQMRRAAVSVVSNIAEGFARRTNREFTQFLYVSHGSVAEVQAQLYAAFDLGRINKGRFDQLYSLCDEVSKMTMGLIKYLSAKPSTPGRSNSRTH